MANPTTNFGWVMPTSASLVTNLPADFNVFGQGVDTSMQYLLGGTTGQVLSKTSGTNMAFTWATPTDQVPLTTKGDLFTFTTVDARLAVGTNNYVLGADSAQATGLAWQTSPQSVMTATGDIMYASAANTPARLGIGSASQVLTVAAGIPSWATAASGTTFVGCRAYAADASITTGTDTVILFSVENFDTDAIHSTTSNTDRFTIPSGKDGKWLVTAQAYFETAAVTNTGERTMYITKNATNANQAQSIYTQQGIASIVSSTDILNCVAGDIIRMKVYQAQGTSITVGNGSLATYIALAYLGA